MTLNIFKVIMEKTRRLIQKSLERERLTISVRIRDVDHNSRASPRQLGVEVDRSVGWPRHVRHISWDCRAE
jgi:hypothetical protein